MMHTLQQLRTGQLEGSTRLRLSDGLTHFPEEIFSLAATLEILDLSQNELTHLPDDFGRLSRLKIGFFSDNRFSHFPEVLGQCPQLEMIGFKSNQIESISETALPPTTRWLILTNNRLQTLPRSIGRCSRMQKLMLAGNQLTALPDELSHCTNLGLLRISANRIQQLPGWLWTMPRLSWLAFSGNPCQIRSQVAVPELPATPWEELDLVQQLGEGASGIISKAIRKNAATHYTPHEVAVKVFKGEVTSDGWPTDEMAACAAAGEHPNLVKVLGKITNHPIGKQGLVLDLIPASYTNLGGPPSFDSCTRDVFAPGTTFSIPAILEIATGIASLAAQLHSKGIMHGDLYAHNTLINPAFKPLFGDFGAATQYDATDVILSTALQRLEVSAFGCLLDDLLQHVSSTATEHFILQQLKTLRDDCINPTVAERPLFDTIITRLEALTVSLL